MRTWTVLLATLIVTLPGAATAQRRWDVALRGGVALPTQELGNAELETGVGFEATVSYRLLEHLAVYGGWGWRQFGTDANVATFAGTDIDVEETGYVLGLRFEHPLAGAGSPALVLRGGATFAHI
ncbi:MAG: outer membrane beta-barrel protein, partial [Gemmatimonadales bacterium]